jgi:hypothetical protein
MIPFEYPERPHERKHGPRGYSRPESYLPWMRDEFAFRCIYCLDREAWNNYIGRFAVEHFLPVCSYPEQQLDYDNLVYSCVSCNLTKAHRHVLDPTVALHRDSVKVHDDGRIEALTKDAAKLIDKMLLDSQEARAYRRRWISILRLAQRYAPQLYEELLSYPPSVLPA